MARGRMYRVAVGLALVAALLLASLAGSGCIFWVGDDWDDFVGTWTGTGTDICYFSMTVRDNGKIDYDIDSCGGGYVWWNDVEPDWDGDNFTITNYDEDGDWWTLTVNFSTDHRGIWSLIGNLNWLPVSGTVMR